MYIVGLEINNEIFGKNLLKTDSINSIMTINEKEKIKIYPNPATNIIEVNFTNNSKREIRLVNENGKSLIVTESFEKRIILNIEKFKSGLYILSIKNGLIITNEKILIE